MERIACTEWLGLWQVCKERVLSLVPAPKLPPRLLGSRCWAPEGLGAVGLSGGGKLLPVSLDSLSGGLQTKPHCSGNKIFYIFINIMSFGFRGWWWLWSLLSVGISWAVMKAGKVNSPLICPWAPQLWPWVRQNRRILTCCADGWLNCSDSYRKKFTCPWLNNGHFRNLSKPRGHNLLCHCCSWLAQINYKLWWFWPY